MNSLLISHFQFVILKIFKLSPSTWGLPFCLHFSALKLLKSTSSQNGRTRNLALTLQNDNSENGSNMKKMILLISHSMFCKVYRPYWEINQLMVFFVCYICCFCYIFVGSICCFVRITLSPDWEMNQWVVCRTSAACKLLWYRFPSLEKFLSNIFHFFYLNINVSCTCSYLSYKSI